MEIQIHIDCDSICRVCLQEGDLTSIYNDFDKNFKIYQKINKLVNFEIKLNSQVPQQICSKCIYNLNIAYDFKLQIENAEDLFKNVVLSDNDDNNEYIVTTYNPNTDSENENIFSTSTDKIKPINRIISNSPISSRNIIINSIKSEDENLMIEENDQIIEDHTYDDDNVSIPEVQNNIEEILISGDTIKLEDNDAKLEELIDFDEKILELKLSSTIAKETENNCMVPVKKNFKIDNSGKPLQICEICGNQYKYKHALECHMRRHRNEKPFPCEICGRAFVMSFELRRHMRTHTKEKPYGCRFCERKFSDFGSRIKHERTHTGERPYVCEDCGKSFAYSHVLASHKLIHTGEKRYGCEVCEKRFTKSHHLKAHMNTHFRDKRERKIINPHKWTAVYNEALRIACNSNDEQILEDKDDDIELNLN